MIHRLAFAGTFLVCLTYVFIVGGRPERVAMTAQLGALLLSMFAMSFRWAPIHGLPTDLALVDVLLAVTLTAIALRANRLWPIVLAGMQIATVLAHLGRALGFPMPNAGYAIFIQLWAWPMLIVTMVGAYKHYARIRRLGLEPDWKPLWPNSMQASSHA
jgi:hypothetical protein